jgi:hypothetical protein
MQCLVPTVIDRMIIELATHCRIFSTDHVARWLNGYSRPNKKALTFIQPLVNQKILETKEKVQGKPRGFEPHIFRLTKIGREQRGVTYHPVPLSNNRKIYHWLMFGHLYMDMWEIEKPKLFLLEQRLNDGKFSPDIFAIWKGRALWIEVQKSPLTSKQWAKKWDRYNDYIRSGLYRSEPWNREGNVKPRIVAISKQMPETILSGNDYPVDIVENIKELPHII